MEYTFDAFISYSQKDSFVCEGIRESLCLRGLKPWIDYAEISSIDDNFTIAMMNGISCSRIVVILLSENYLNSYYCLLEFYNAIRIKTEEKPLIRVIALQENLRNHPIYKIFEEQGTLFTDHEDVANKIVRWIDHCDKSSRSIISGGELIEIFNNDSRTEESKIYIKQLTSNFVLSENMEDAARNRDFPGLRKLLKTAKGKFFEQLGNGPNYLSSLLCSRIGYAYHVLGDMENAVYFREIELNVTRTMYGENSINFLIASDALVKSLINTTAANQAVELGEETLKHARELFPNYHPIKLDLLNTLGTFLFREERYEDCRILLKEAVEIINSADLDSKLINCLAIRTNYAAALMHTGKADESWALLKEILNDYISERGPHHTTTGQVYIHLATCALKMNEASLANQYAHQAMLIFMDIPEAHYIRIYAIGIALECAYAASDENQKKWIFDNFVTPALNHNNIQTEELKSFLLSRRHLWPRLNLR